MERVTDSLLHPARLYSAKDLSSRPSPIPASPGVYAWYFDMVPTGVPTDGCQVCNDNYRERSASTGMTG